MLKAGITNVDIGCNQVNWRVHARSFASPNDVLDPLQNARFAAEFLRSLYAETGSWADAVARYHSRNPERAARYRCRIAAALMPATKFADCD
jgi:soluble lytic murein transglycosylase-like protein